MTRRNAFLSLMGALGASPVQAATVPRPATEIAVTLPDGTVRTLADYRGKVLSLSFILTT